jgi:hypothetical protein
MRRPDSFDLAVAAAVLSLVGYLWILYAMLSGWF